MGVRSVSQLAAASWCSALLIIGGCASPGSGTRSVPDTATASVVLYSTLGDAIKASMAALAEKRLDPPTVDWRDDGAIVVGTLSGIAGAIYNSHGGTGRVSIVTPYPGRTGTRLTISASTVSRIDSEPVGAMDALKGYNFNDPKIAGEIIESIRRKLPQVDVAALVEANERARVNWGAEQERLAAEAKRKTDEEAGLVADATAGSRVNCMNEADCRKAFQLAQIYVSTKSDMKIQLATDTIIETYNPTSSYRLGAKVVKTPGRGQSAVIAITVTCKDCDGKDEQTMRRSALILMRDFRPFVEARLRQ
jgi:hypothetical protein